MSNLSSIDTVVSRPRNIDQCVMRLRSQMIVNPEGGSLDRMTGERLTFATGYIVGGVHPDSVIRGESTVTGTALAEVFRSARHLATHGARTVVGYWVDGATGDMWVEVSEWFATARRALEVADARDELAIWDCKANAEIRVN